MKTLERKDTDDLQVRQTRMDCARFRFCDSGKNQYTPALLRLRAPAIVWNSAHPRLGSGSTRPWTRTLLSGIWRPQTWILRSCCGKPENNPQRRSRTGQADEQLASSRRLIGYLLNFWVSVWRSCFLSWRWWRRMPQMIAMARTQPLSECNRG